MFIHGYMLFGLSHVKYKHEVLLKLRLHIGSSIFLSFHPSQAFFRGGDIMHSISSSKLTTPICHISCLCHVCLTLSELNVK